jgi:glutamate/tyrosine decarboxylase-like PLP-dependent enzyme
MPEEISDLRARRAPIEMSPGEFRQAGHEMVEAVGSFLQSLRERPVNRDHSPTALRSLLPAGGLPDGGADARKLLRETARLVIDHSLLNGHPRFFGYITSSAAPIGALADLLAAAVNPNLGGWQLSPIATEIELQCVRWIAEMLGLPPGGGGLLVSGGNVANFTCFLAARRAKGGAGLRSSGLPRESGRLRIYASTEAHTWIQKAADLFGHGTDSIRWIGVDDRLRLDVADLRVRIEEDRGRGDRPFLVVGTAGSVGTGAVDPLPEIADVAREHDLWFHVDGAYGSFAAILPDAPEELRGMAKADSVAADPHKWLYAPLEAGCALVRDPSALPDAFAYRPSYYHFEGEDADPRVNFYEVGMQNSRGFRALKVWLGLRQVGRAGYAKMISDDVRLARHLARLLRAEPEIEVCTQDLSITTFRYVPSDLDRASDGAEPYLNRLNETLLQKLKSSGETFLSNVVVGGKFLLRACIVNFRTSLADIEALPGIITRHGAAARKGSDPFRAIER